MGEKWDVMKNGGMRYISHLLSFLHTTKCWLFGHLLSSLLSMFRHGCLLSSLFKSWIKLLHPYYRDLVHGFSEEKRKKGSSHDL